MVTTGGQWLPCHPLAPAPPLPRVSIRQGSLHPSHLHLLGYSSEAPGHASRLRLGAPRNTVGSEYRPSAPGAVASVPSGQEARLLRPPSAQSAGHSTPLQHTCGPGILRAQSSCHPHLWLLPGAGMGPSSGGSPVFPPTISSPLNVTMLPPH